MAKGGESDSRISSGSPLARRVDLLEGLLTALPIFNSDVGQVKTLHVPLLDNTKLYASLQAAINRGKNTTG